MFCQAVELDHSVGAMVVASEISSGNASGSGGRLETVSAFSPSPKTLLPQPNLRDRLLELPGVPFQTGDVRFPDARPAATRSRFGKAAGNSIRDSIGPRWQAADAPLSDTCRRTAIAASQHRRDKDQPN
jgi:hypothetical protein